VLTDVAAAVSSGSQPVLPGFLNDLASPLSHYGLWAILVLVFIEDFGIPLPGETILIAGAIYAGSGRLNVVEVGLVGFAAAVLGDNVGYCIGRFGGRALISRWGKYIFLTPDRLEKTERFFDRHGGKIIAVARFIEGLRQANGIIAGITKMHWLKFGAFNALGAALWVGAWVSIGYFAGQHITTIYNDITRYSLYVVIVLVVAIVVWVVLRVRKHRKSKTAQAEPATDAAEAAGVSAAASTSEVVSTSDTADATETADASKAASTSDTANTSEAASTSHTASTSEAASTSHTASTPEAASTSDKAQA
jgi:membrane protein DedA with SNARE-associated domain